MRIMKSAPHFKAAHNSGESGPSVTLDWGGADTAQQQSGSEG